MESAFQPTLKMTGNLNDKQRKITIHVMRIKKLLLLRFNTVLVKKRHYSSNILIISTLSYFIK